MEELRTEIEIAAPLPKVWSILTDLNKWKEWNPIVNQVSGVAVYGAKVSITMRGKDGKNAHKYNVVIIKLEAPKSFQWRAKMIAGFLFTNEKIFELEAIATGTRLIHIEAFSGMLIPMFWSKLYKGALPMLHTMNEALKTLAEKDSG